MLVIVEFYRIAQSHDFLCPSNHRKVTLVVGSLNLFRIKYPDNLKIVEYVKPRGNISLCLTRGTFIFERNKLSIYAKDVTIYVDDFDTPVFDRYDLANIVDLTITFSTYKLFDSSLWKVSNHLYDNWASKEFIDSTWLSSSSFSSLFSSQAQRDSPVSYYRTFITIRPEYRFLTFVIEFCGEVIAYLNGVAIAHFLSVDNFNTSREFVTVPNFQFPDPSVFSIEFHKPLGMVHHPSFLQPFHVDGYPSMTNSTNYHSYDLITSSGEVYHNPFTFIHSKYYIHLDSKLDYFTFYLRFRNKIPINLSSVMITIENSPKNMTFSFNTTQPKLQTHLTNVTSIPTEAVYRVHIYNNLAFHITLYRLYLTYPSTIPDGSFHQSCSSYQGEGFVEEGGQYYVPCQPGKEGGLLYQCSPQSANELVNDHNCKYLPPQPFSYNLTKNTFYLEEYMNLSVDKQFPSNIMYEASPKLPPGLDLDKSTGRIFGFPKEVGNHTISVGSNNPDNKVYSVVDFRITILDSCCSYNEKGNIYWTRPTLYSSSDKKGYTVRNNTNLYVWRRWDECYVEVSNYYCDHGNLVSVSKHCIIPTVECLIVGTCVFIMIGTFAIMMVMKQRQKKQRQKKQIQLPVVKKNKVIRRNAV